MPRPAPLAIAVAALLTIVLGLAAWRYWPSVPAPPAPQPAAAPVTPPAAVAAPPAISAMPDAPHEAPQVAPLAATDNAVELALSDLLGRTAVLTLLQTDGFAARVVATVDNLPRAHVAPRLWPLNPTAGRFTVADDGRIAAANDRRYDAAVALLDALPPDRAAAFYHRLAPQLQSAYADLGYPGQPFHARLLAVIDHLLETPALSRPLTVTLTQVKGSIPSERPWVRYEYVDPALQSASAGQRLLLRLGPDHQRRVLAWLRDLRARL
jgi:hypothetical protein